MTRISAFRFSSSDGYSIDLPDAKDAVRVTPASGTVVLRQGEDRINDWAIAGDDVLAFDLVRQHGRLHLQVQFNACDGLAREDLGYIEDIDLEVAKQWVERVNTIYSKHERCAGSDRLAPLLRYPVIHDICDTGVSWAQPGDYIYSADRTHVPPPKQLEKWERYIVERQVEHMRSFTSFDGQIDITPRNRMPHNYLYLSKNIKYDSENFEHRVTQPLELIFDRRPRHDSLSIVPFGTVEHFAIVFAGRCRPQRDLHLNPNTLGFRSFEAWMEETQKRSEGKDRLLVCSPENHSVDYSIYNAMQRGELSDKQRQTANDPTTLADWLYRWCDQGIVACDIGWAYEIQRSFLDRHPAMTVGFALVPYEKPVPIGLCFRQDDPKWGELLSMALTDLLSTGDSEVIASYERARHLAQHIGVRLQPPSKRAA